MRVPGDWYMLNLSTEGMQLWWHLINLLRNPIVTSLHPPSQGFFFTPEILWSWHFTNLLRGPLVILLHHPSQGLRVVSLHLSLQAFSCDRTSPTFSGMPYWCHFIPLPRIPMWFHFTSLARGSVVMALHFPSQGSPCDVTSSPSPGSLSEIIWHPLANHSVVMVVKNLARGSLVMPLDSPFQGPLVMWHGCLTWGFCVGIISLTGPLPPFVRFP